MSSRPLRIALPTEDDIQLALEGDKPAHRRVIQQRHRCKKRDAEIAAWDMQQALAR